MKSEVKTPVVIAVAVVVLGGILCWGFKVAGASGNLDHGQIPYTPGVPPWREKDPAKRGPGATADMRPGQSAIDNRSH